MQVKILNKKQKGKFIVFHFEEYTNGSLSELNVSNTIDKRQQ